MKKLLIALLLMLTLGASIAQAADESDVYISEGYVYALLPDGTAEIVMYTGDVQELVIPAQIGGYRVTSIGDFAVMWCTYATRVTIPDSVVALGANPFAYCASLTDIVVSPDNPVLEAVDGVLFDREAMTLLCYPSGREDEVYAVPPGTVSIGSDAFSNCDSLVRIALPEGLTSIGDYAFIYCTALTDVAIPGSVDVVGMNPFADCPALTEVSISPGHPWLKIDDGMLFDTRQKRLIGCLGVHRTGHYAVPQGVEIVGGSAFFDCHELISVELPEGVTEIGDYAFNYCDGLMSVTVPGSVTTIAENAFEGCGELMHLIVPRDSFAHQWCVEHGQRHVFAD